MVKGLVFVSVLVLLASAYLDNSRGPLFPYFVEHYQITFTTTALFLVYGHLVAVLVNFLLVIAVNRMTERNVALAILLLPALLVLVAVWVRGPSSLLFLGTLWGAAVAALGSLCNLLLILGTEPGQRARFFAGLHMMYGFGSLIGPPVVAFVLDNQWSWKIVLYLLAPIIVLLAVTLVKVLPAEKKQTRVVSSGIVFPVGRQWLVVASFFCYVGAEVFISMWMTTYLTTVGLDLPMAAGHVSLFFLAMGMTRLLCFLFLRGTGAGMLAIGALVLSSVAFGVGTMFHLPMVAAFSGVMGPFFPLFLGTVNQNFRETAQELTIWILLAGQLAQAVFHLTVGRIVDWVGIESTYPFAAVFLLLTAGLAGTYLKIEQRLQLYSASV